MFEVLAFVYENYFAGQTSPEFEYLEKKLNSVGFEADEIDDALVWLKGLRFAANSEDQKPWIYVPSPLSTRVHPRHEQNHLGMEAIGFIRFLEQAGALPPPMSELVIERAMAAPGGPVTMDDLKMIILLVFWGFGAVPDALLLDELSFHSAERTVH